MGKLARQEVELNHSWTARVKYLVENANQILENRNR
jgi:hypothetical protein